MPLGGGIRSSIYAVSRPVFLFPKQGLVLSNNSIGKSIFKLDF
jgi:hypothetical protein